MKKALSLLVILGFCLSLAGCYTHLYDVGDGAPNGKEVYKKWSNHFLLGIIGDNKYDINDICPSGNATVKDEMTFVNGLVSMLTFGIIYNPTTVTILCDSKKAATLDISAEKVAAIVMHPSFPDYVAQVAPELLPQAMEAIANANALYAGDARMAMK